MAPGLDHLAGQKTPSHPRRSQSYSRRDAVLLQPLGPIPEPRATPVCPIRGRAIHPRRGEHDRQRANGPILVSDERRLCRRTARRQSRSQRGPRAPGVRADHTISLRSHLDQHVSCCIAIGPIKWASSHASSLMNGEFSIGAYHRPPASALRSHKEPQLPQIDLIPALRRVRKVRMKN
jgi:hypothetical protein